MNVVRAASERGFADHGWLRSYHSFSFADYYDPEHMGFGALRVINEDRVAPGAGFGTHGHRDMEIISYVLEGALEHKDSLGTGSVIRPGDVQRMSAGRGVLHSEFNASKEQEVHFLQIWIEPNVSGVEPSYEQVHVPEAERRGRLRLIASPDGREGSVRIHQDATVWAAVLEGRESVVYEIPRGRRAYAHVARGSVTANGQRLGAGDALKVTGEESVTLEQPEAVEVLVFDLP